MNIKTDLKAIENLYSDIKRTAEHLDISKGFMKYYINSEGFVNGIIFKIQTTENPEKIRYNEYKALLDFVDREHIDKIEFESKDAIRYPAHNLYVFGNPVTDYSKVGSFLNIVIEYEEDKIHKYIDEILPIEETHNEAKESFKEYIEFLEDNGYKNKIDEEMDEIIDLKGIDFVEFEIEHLYNTIKSIEVEKINVVFSLDEYGHAEFRPKYIVYVNEDPENISLEEYRKIERKNILLKYKDKNLEFINGGIRHADNVVYLSIESTPKTIVKYVTEVKGEGLEHILRILKNKGYFDTGIK